MSTRPLKPVTKKRRRKKRNTAGLKFAGNACILLAVLLLIKFVSGLKAESQEPVDYSLAGIGRKDLAVDDESWSLVLVNPDHPIDEDYKVTLSEVENGYQFDERAVGYLKNMLADAHAAGLSPVLCSAYRTQDKQEQLFNNKVSETLSQGHSYFSAYEEARGTVAYPGTSEHQLGLAVDIMSEQFLELEEEFERTPEGIWLKENCHKYGFILRFPKGKEEITGIIYEPWHFRYVGANAAEKIMEQGICLEEYLNIATPL